MARKQSSRTRSSSAPGRRAAAPAARAPDALSRYRQKRDFSRSPEPSGARPRRGRKRPIFVVQKHAATRLHYDLRLESGGVLKSWAVPKEPVLDPAVKRLAVEVEDHPLAYGSFEGDIPAGSYGAGHVEIWDSGTYRRLVRGREADGDIDEDIARGKVEFSLSGKRLKGSFALVRMARETRKPTWLLIKLRDEHTLPGRAGRPPTPREPGPGAARRNRSAR